MIIVWERNSFELFRSKSHLQRSSISFLLGIILAFEIYHQTIIGANAWRSRECPIDSQDNRESYLCIRPCDYEEKFSLKDDHHNLIGNYDSSKQAKSDDSYFVVFFPPKSDQYEKNRFKCPAGFRQTNENGRCFCERPYTPYEMEMQRREKCDQTFERCRMYGAKPYDCNHIIDACPTNLIKEYCLAGKVFKMRFSKVVYEFCHAFIRLPDDGRRHFLEPQIDRLKQ
ncbi:tRNA-specific adenosine deaminase 2 [Sarcoptes scabiei]|nr:tRNA-specific adenosine deaminase 2 [Sarcoptes scabiei]